MRKWRFKNLCRSLCFLGIIFLFLKIEIVNFPLKEAEICRRIRVSSFSFQLKDFIHRVCDGTIPYGKIIEELENLSKVFPQLGKEITPLRDRGSSRRKLLRNAETFINAHKNFFNDELQKADFTIKLMLAEEVFYLLNNQHSPIAEDANLKAAIQAISAQNPSSLLINDSSITSYLLGKYSADTSIIRKFIDNLRTNTTLTPTAKDALTLLAIISADTFSNEKIFEEFLFKISDDAFNKNSPKPPGDKLTALKLFEKIYYLSNIQGLGRILKHIVSRLGSEDNLRGSVAELEEAVKLEKQGYKMLVNGTFVERELEIALLSYHSDGNGQIEIDAMVVLDSPQGNANEIGISWIEVTHYNADKKPSLTREGVVIRDKEGSHSIYYGRILKHFANFAVLGGKKIAIGEGREIDLTKGELIIKNATGQVVTTQKPNFTDRLIFTFSFKNYPFPTRDGNINYSDPEVTQFISDITNFLIGLRNDIIKWQEDPKKYPDLAWIEREVDNLASQLGISKDEIIKAISAHKDFSLVVIPDNLDDQLIKYLLSLPSSP